MIEFRCPNCSQKLIAPNEHAGRICKCLKCKRKLTIPLPYTAPPEVHNAETDAAVTALPKPLDEKLLELPPKEKPPVDKSGSPKTDKELLESLGFKPAPQYTGERKFPWPIDVLLYPCSMPGLTNLAILIGVQLVLSLIQGLLWFVGSILPIAILLINILIGIYVGWYLAECVQDSAKGGTRAPEAFAATEGFSGMWSRVLYLAAVCIIFILPAILYRMYTNYTDVIFWVLVAWGIIFFPMGLLAMVMFDSTYALNPLFLLGTILRVFLQYIGLLVILMILAHSIWIARKGLADKDPFFWFGLFRLLITYYWSFVMAHILGRFYWRYKDKLDWGI